MDLDFIRETGRISDALDERLEAVKAHLRENDIEALWSATVEDARAAHRLPRVTFWEAESSMSLDYDLTLHPNGDLYFSGTDREGDFHSYTMPATFLFPETRDQAVAALNEKYAKRRAALDMTLADEQEQQRARDEATYERLRLSLGKPD